MSLKIWLPLQGTMENKGISNITVDGHSSTVDEVNGKLNPKCQKFARSTSQYISLPPILNANSEFTYCCWFKTLNLTQNQCLFSQRTGINATGFSIFFMGAETSTSTADRLRFDDGASFYSTDPIDTTDKWYHLAFVRTSTHKYIYINGALSGVSTRNNATTVSTNSIIIGCSQQNAASSSFSNAINGYLQDIRIYDNALSAATVKEIAQGLVMHYKLDGGLFGNPNLISSYDTSFRTIADGTVTLFTNQMNSGTQEIVSNINGVKKCLHLHSNGSKNRIYKTLSASANKAYTFSIDYYSSSTQSIAIRIEANGGDYSQKAFDSIGYAGEGWKRLSTSTSILTSNTTLYYFIYCANETDCYIKNIKIEEGQASTPWCPYESEININRTIVKDSSGYGYNGTIIGSPIINKDSIRYSTCMSFPTDTDGILTPFPLSLQNNSFTYSFWIRPYNEDGTRSVYSASYSGVTCSIEKTASNKLRFYWNNSPDLTTTNLTIQDGIWQHIAVVKDEDKSHVYCYYNGVLMDTFTNTFSDKDFTGSLRIARDTRGTNVSYTGEMSDFRIYSTALSSNDIKTLYNVAMRIDKNYNSHAFDFIEEQKYQINHNGNITMPNLYENGILQCIHYDKTIYTEPDGSQWVHIAHHNNPASSGLFAQDSDWEHGVYIDADRWYDAEEIMNLLVKYEFMIKEKKASTDTEVKYRWIQTPNPLTCTHADVKPNTNLTFITGYSDTHSGGLWKINNSTRLCVANSNTTSTNWYGAFGAWKAYSSGIPAYQSGSIGTGYSDLYVRVYPGAGIIKNYGFKTTELIER